MTESPGRTRARSGALASLSEPDFRNFWLGMLFLMGAIQMQMIAQSYLVFDLTGSPALLGLVNSGFAIPMLVLALFGGALADRLDRKKIIQIGQVAFLLTALAVALTVKMGAITWYYLFAASMVMGAVFSFIGPARQAMIPDLVPAQNLTNAIALNSAGMSAMTLLAPAFAGVLYAVIGPAGVYFVLAVLGSVSVLITTLLPKTVKRSAAVDAKILADIVAGIAYIRRTPMVRILLVMGLATALLAMPFRFLMPIFVVEVYHKGPEAMGLLVSLMGLGALVGSMFMAQVGRWKRGLLLIATTILTGVALLLVAALPFYIVALVLMLALGLGDAGRRTLNQALIMEVSENQYRGRVMSVYMLNFALMPLGVLPAGFVAQYTNGQVAVGILAVLLLIFAVVILVTQKELRRFD